MRPILLIHKVESVIYIRITYILKRMYNISLEMWWENTSGNFQGKLYI